MSENGSGKVRQERLALQIFGRVCGLPPAELASALLVECGSDDALRQRVGQLLGFDVSPIAALGAETAVGGFLDDEIRKLQERHRSDVASLGPLAPAGRVPSHYRLLCVLGQGGMATVYEAEQVHPRRMVAIKVIRGASITPEMRSRFDYEAQVLANLQHPHIAQLYEAETRLAGAADGRLDASASPSGECYLAMELVRGLPIDEHVQQKRLSPREIIELVRMICDAVAYAHGQGVLHRDLKPGNILVDQAGRPKVLDFGIARAIDPNKWPGQITLTGGGQLLGTLPYMAPEQVDSRLGQADARCDVYALGVLLYRLLSGCLPIDTSGQGIAGSIERIRTQIPAKLGTHDRTLRGDLQRVVARCLEKDPRRRYPSVRALDKDLDCYLIGRRITAAPLPRIGSARAALWWRRKPVAFAVGVGVIVVLLVRPTWFFPVSKPASRDDGGRAEEEVTTQRAETELARRAELQRDHAELALYRNSLELADLSIRSGLQGRAVHALNSSPVALRGWEWRFLLNAATETSAYQSVEMEPAVSGSPLSIRQGLYLSRDQSLTFLLDDGSVSRMDIATGRRIWRRSTGARRCVADAAGPFVAALVRDDRVALLDRSDGHAIRELSEPGSVLTSLACDGVTVAAGSADGRVILWDGQTGNVVQSWKASDTAIGAVRWTSTHNLISGSEEVEIKRWVLGATVATVASSRLRDPIASMSLSQDGSTLMVCLKDQSLVVFAAGTFQALAAADVRGPAACLETNGERLFVHDGRTAVHVFEPRGGDVLLTLTAKQSSPVRLMAFDGDRLLAVSDRLIEVWSGMAPVPRPDTKP